jgi:outer membrane protein assembly factor BamB
MSSSRSRQASGQQRGKSPRSAANGRGGSAGPKRRELPKWTWLLGGVIIVVVIVAVLLVATSSSSSDSALFKGSGYPNGNTSNTRYTGGPIDSSTVADLKTAWTLPLTTKSEYGSYSSAPIVSGGVVYSQDLDSNVQAIDLQTGKVLWTKSFESPDQGPNGLVVQGGHVYGATTSAAFALEQSTGKLLWSVMLVRNEHEGIDMAPGYHNGIVYVATVPGNTNEFYKGEGVGVMWALDGATGAKLWHFNTVPENLWSAENVSINSGGGLWYTPAFDNQGYMYVGVANPGPFPGTTQFPWGSSRPGPDLYTDSIVKLDAATGKLQWYYQLTPHDLYDWDLQDPPILAPVGGRQVVLAAGKAGVVIALDAATGKLLWKREVGLHDGHNNDDLYAMKGELSKLKTPETVYPGLLGGVIAPMASNGSKVFVPVVNDPVTVVTPGETQEPGPVTGELVAVNIANGTVAWTRKLEAAAFGAATAVNDLVFTTSFNGTVYALNDNTGEVAWQASLPAGSNTGVAVEGDTLIAPAGIATAAGQTPEITAFRLPGANAGG